MMKASSQPNLLVSLTLEQLEDLVDALTVRVQSLARRASAHDVTLERLAAIRRILADEMANAELDDMIADTEPGGYETLDRYFSLPRNRR